VGSGQFREDLLHRLDLYRIPLPPLRERGDDILELANRMLAVLCQRHRVGAKRISAAGQQRLLRYPWPGNARELAHELERALVFEEGQDLELRQLATDRPGSAPAPARADEWFHAGFRFPEQGFSLEEAVNRLIQHALEQSGQNVSAAARLLGVTRDYLRYRLTPQKSRESGGSNDPASVSAG
jgi:DNA-binding NtrC family response regulator